MTLNTKGKRHLEYARQKSVNIVKIDTVTFEGGHSFIFLASKTTLGEFFLKFLSTEVKVVKSD